MSRGRGLRVASRVARGTALAVTIARLVGRREPDRGAAVARPPGDGTISVVIPARDEATRLGPCLAGLRGAPGVIEVIVVDDRSTDATAEVAAAHGARVITGRPLPTGWAGKAWALQQGIEAATGEWVVTLDADTRPLPGLPRAVCDRGTRFDFVTVAGRFECPTGPGRWLHPAMLTTLVYRFGRPRPDTAPARPALANGQCMATRREPFLEAGGLAPVRGRLVEDVALARHLAAAGWRVGFVPGEDLLTVRMFESFAGTWSGWGRSIALPGVETGWRPWADLALVALAQALPLPRVLVRRGDVLDAAAVAVRLGTLAGTARAYTRCDAAYWLSPLADPLAVARLGWSLLRPSRTWRGRTYPAPG